MSMGSISSKQSLYELCRAVYNERFAVSAKGKTVGQLEEPKEPFSWGTRP